jgi:acetyl esterase/lipase
MQKEGSLDMGDSELSLAGAEQAPVALPAGSTCRLNVEYAVAGGVSLRLDAAVPPGAGPGPGLILIHGGGWQEGERQGFWPVIPGYLARGLACFPITYRLSGQATFPAALEDCLAAVRWVRAHAAELNVDPDRLAVLGGSAGAHLALLVATAKPTAQDLNAQGQPLKSLVAAVVSLAGPTDLRAFGHVPAGLAPAATADAEAVREVVVKFLGGTLEEVPERYAEASPLHHVTGDCPPTMLVYGTADGLVPPAQATAMAEQLRAAGVPLELVGMEGLDHNVAGMNDLPQAVEFLVRHLAPSAS